LHSALETCADTRRDSQWPGSSTPNGTDPRDAFERLLPVVRRVVRSVGHRYRLRNDDVDELFSTVCMKLLDQRHAVLGRFEGRSGIATYLTTVVSRVWLDQRTAREGKWRPSAKATRLGHVAVALERLIQREGLPVAEAIASLRSAGKTDASVEHLHWLAGQFPVRQGTARFMPLDDVAEIAGPVAVAEGDDARPRRLHLAAVLKTLPPDERLLLRRRFAKGETVASIARSLSCDQRDLYRHYDRLFASIRTRVDARERSLPPAV